MPFGYTAQGQGQQGYIASLSQGNPVSLQDFNQGAQIMQPVQTQYMQNQMQNTNMTNNRIVCDQGVPQATYMCNLQSGAPNTNTQANGLNQRQQVANRDKIIVFRLTTAAKGVCLN